VDEQREGFAGLGGPFRPGFHGSLGCDRIADSMPLLHKGKWCLTPAGREPACRYVLKGSKMACGCQLAGVTPKNSTSNKKRKSLMLKSLPA
jgi:hypothetical protein